MNRACGLQWAAIVCTIRWWSREQHCRTGAAPKWEKASFAHSTNSEMLLAFEKAPRSWNHFGTTNHSNVTFASMPCLLPRFTGHKRPLNVLLTCCCLPLVQSTQLKTMRVAETARQTIASACCLSIATAGGSACTMHGNPS
jgi:hypothetical protein